MNNDIPTHPVQSPNLQYLALRAPQAVTLRAYEVYCHVYGPQEAVVTGGCRGGFGVGELVALLYAHSFPKHEWKERVKEAMHGAVL